LNELLRPLDDSISQLITLKFEFLIEQELNNKFTKQGITSWGFFGSELENFNFVPRALFPPKLGRAGKETREES